VHAPNRERPAVAGEGGGNSGSGANAEGGVSSGDQLGGPRGGEGGAGGTALFFAGIYEQRPPRKEGGAMETTVAVITVAANSKFEAIHHRQPAVLETSKAIETWLSPRSPLLTALKVLDSASDSCFSWWVLFPKRGAHFV
jgi:hypothetical protein